MIEEAAAASEEEEVAVSGQAVRERCIKQYVPIASKRLKYPLSPAAIDPSIAENVIRIIDHKDFNGFTDFS